MSGFSAVRRERCRSRKRRNFNSTTACQTQLIDIPQIPLFSSKPIDILGSFFIAHAAVPRDNRFERGIDILRHPASVAAYIEMRARFEPCPQLPRPARACGPARRSSRSGRGRTRGRAASAGRCRASPRVRRDSRNRVAACCSPKNSQLRPASPRARRSCRKPRNGATPVPGPTMIIGVSPDMRRPEVRRLLHEHRHVDVACAVGEKGRRHALAMTPAIVVPDRRDRQMDFARDAPSGSMQSNTAAAACV